jgi:hypothetical protein
VCKGTRLSPGVGDRKKGGSKAKHGGEVEVECKTTLVSAAPGMSPAKGFESEHGRGIAKILPITMWLPTRKREHEHDISVATPSKTPTQSHTRSRYQQARTPLETTETKRRTTAFPMYKRYFHFLERPLSPTQSQTKREKKTWKYITRRRPTTTPSSPCCIRKEYKTSQKNRKEKRRAQRAAVAFSFARGGGAAGLWVAYIETSDFPILKLQSPRLRAR